MNIFVSEGAAEYVTVTITETTGKDIHTAPVQMAVAVDKPTTWYPADQVTGTGATVVAQLLLTSARVTDTLGQQFYVWVKIGDNPETVIRRVNQPVTIT